MKKILTSLAVLVVLALLGGVYAQAAAVTNNLTIGGTSGYPDKYSGKTFLLEKTVDFTVTTGTSNGLFRLINIPANTYVMNVFYKLELNKNDYTGEENAMTVDIGYDAAANRWFDDASVTTADVASASGSYTNPVHFTAADTIDLLLNRAANQLKITVRALVIPVAGD